MAFCLLYYGTLGVIGLSSPDNFYSGFVAHYLNYISFLRASLLLASKSLLLAAGYSIHLQGDYVINIVGGGGVRIVYSCIGYGVMSFWGAFVIANKGRWQKKLKWILAGWLTIWLINIARISFLLLAGLYHWPLPLGWDHHTWFNVLAYGFIFGLIYFYDRSEKKAIDKISSNQLPV